MPFEQMVSASDMTAMRMLQPGNLKLLAREVSHEFRVSGFPMLINESPSRRFSRVHGREVSDEFSIFRFSRVYKILS